MLLLTLIMLFIGLKFNLSDSSDSAEANPLGYKNDYIQVYSNSWGPSDGGYIVDGPGHLLKQTFENAVENVRPPFKTGILHDVHICTL